MDPAQPVTQGYPDPLDAAALAAIRMPNRDGFVSLVPR